MTALRSATGKRTQAVSSRNATELPSLTAGVDSNKGSQLTDECKLSNVQSVIAGLRNGCKGSVISLLGRRHRSAKLS